MVRMVVLTKSPWCESHDISIEVIAECIILLFCFGETVIFVGLESLRNSAAVVDYTSHSLLVTDTSICNFFTNFNTRHCGCWL
jgi:hypothetical protein